MVYCSKPWYTMVYHGIPHGTPCLLGVFIVHTRTVVACLPLRQLGYLVVNWSNRVTHR